MLARFEPWVSCKVPPLADGTYTVRYRASLTKTYKYEWTGVYWIDDKGQRVPQLRLDFLKWYAVSRKNVSPFPNVEQEAVCFA